MERPITTDLITIVVVHAILCITLLVALFQSLRAALRSRHGGSQGEVTRGEKSMTGLYVMYGVATLLFTLAVQVAETMSGNKATIIVLDYIGLTYLFFFNTWFRNRVIALLIRVHKEP